MVYVILTRRGGTIDRAFALQEGGQISNSSREKPKLLVVTIPLLKG